MANIAIIGGGVAGLSAGIYARLNGHNASIYERHCKAGGNLTGWDREGYHIDNCIHWLTGTNPNTDLYKIWTDLGALGEVKIYQGKSLYTYEKEGKTLSLYDDINKLEKDMLSIAPEDKKEIKQFIKAVKIIQNISGIGGANNNEKSSILDKIISVPILYKYYKLSTKELAELFTNPLIKGFIVSLLGEHFSSIALLIVFSTFSGKDGGIPEGSSYEMAKRMEKRFLSLGGNLYLNKGVEKINIVDDTAQSITLENGEVVNADYIIVTSDPSVAFNKLLDKKYMPEKLQKAYNNPNNIRFSSYHCAFSCDAKDIPFNGDLIFDLDEEYKNKFKSNYLIIREFSHEPSFAPKGKNIIQSMIFCNENDSLEFIKLKEDKIKYKEKKENIARDIQKIIENKFPQFKGKLKCLDVWTPASYKRYTDSQIGSYMSFIMPSKTIPLKISNRVKDISNVILATQWLHSLGGLPIAARLGKEAIETINKLNK